MDVKNLQPEGDRCMTSCNVLEMPDRLFQRKVVNREIIFVYSHLRKMVLR